MAVAGDTLTGGGLNNTANRVALSKYCTAGVDEYGINDVSGKVAAATIVAARGSFAGLFPGLPMWGTTLTPTTTSTDNWATTANQTVGTYESVRVSFNASERAGIAGEVGVIDLSDAIDPNRTGLWPVNGTAFYATADGTHETYAGNVAIRRSTAWNGIAMPPR